MDFQDIKNRFDSFGFEQQKYLFATDEYQENENEDEEDEDDEDEDSDDFEDKYFG